MLLFCTSFPAFAQDASLSRIDQLLEQINAVSEERRVEVYLELSYEYRREPDVWKVLEFAQKSLISASKLGLEKLELQSELALSYAFLMTEQIDSAIYFGTKHISSLERQIEQHGNNNLTKLNLQNDLINGMLPLALTYQSINDYPSAMGYYDRMLLLIDELEKNGGRALIPTADFTLVYYNLAVLYSNAREYVKAIRYAEETIEEDDRTEGEHQKISGGILMSNIYRELERYEDAITIIEDLFNKYQTTMPKSRQINALLSMARTYAKMKQFDLAIKHTEEALWLSLSTELVEQTAECFRELSIYKEEKQDYQSALHYMKSFISFKVAELNDYDERAIGRIEAKYEGQAEIRAFERELVSQRNRNLAISIGILVLLVLLGIMFWNFRLQKKARRLKDLENQQLIFERSTKLKELELLKERTEKQQEIENLKKERLNSLLSYKQRQLTTSTIAGENVNVHIRKVYEKLLEVKKRAESSQFEQEITEVIKLTKASLDTGKDWNAFKKHFENVHPSFFSNLRLRAKGLTENELKHCAYVQIQLTNKEVANMHGISADSVKMARNRIKKKLDLGAEASLADFLNDVGTEASI